VEFFECIESRKSCRAFLSKDVDKRTLERALRAANRSPSYMNSQPWLFGKKGGTLFTSQLSQPPRSTYPFCSATPFPRITDLETAKSNRPNKSRGQKCSFSPFFRARDFSSKLPSEERSPFCTKASAGFRPRLTRVWPTSYLKGQR
jgi:hypothetical protein